MSDGPVAKIGVEVDATPAVAGLNSVAAAAEQTFVRVETAAKKGGKSIDGLGTGAKPAAEGMDRATRSMVQSIERATAAFSAGSKSSSDYYRVLATQRGIDPATLKPYLDALDAVAPKQQAVTDAIAKTVPALEKTGMSAKATAAALRQVPAQFTDIVVGLQGGQAPLTVLLQQGGQLKDVFGGVGNAAKAMGGYILGLLTPLNVAIAAVGTLGYALYSGSKEAQEFNKALILTGNYAGTSVGSLQRMAAAISQTTGATQGAAAEALTALTASGELSAGQMEKFAATAIRIQKETGVAVGETVKQFIALGKDPVDASVKLNDSTHYLTLAVYNQIKALTEQGRVSEAAALSQKAYSEAMDLRTTALNGNLGLLEKAWRAVGSAASWSWDKMKGVGRAEEVESALERKIKLLDQLQTRLQVAERTGNNVMAGSTRAEIAKQEAEIAPLKEIVKLKDRAAQAVAQEARDVERRAEFDKEYRSSVKKDVLLKTELATAEGKYLSLMQRGIITRKEYNELLAGKRDKYTDKGAVSKSGELDKAQAAFEVEKIQKAYEAKANAFANSEKNLEALRSAGLLDDANYYAAKQLYIEYNTAAEVKALDEEIAREQKRKAIGNTADERAIAQLDIDKKVLELQSKRGKVLADATTASDNLAIAETANAAKIARAYEVAKKAASDYLTTLQLGYSRDLVGQNRGDEFRAREAAKAQITDKYRNDREAALTKYMGGPDTAETRQERDRALEIIAEYQDKALKSWQEHYTKVKEAEADWSTGARRGLENYIDDVANISKATETLFTNAFKSMEDSIVSFVKTGKLDFASLADSIISDLIRIEARRSITGPLASAAQSFFGFADGGIMSSSGSLPLNKYASGGIATSPQVALFGEGSMNEAYVPLPDGRSIPVTMSGNGGGSITVNQPIVINAPNAAAGVVEQINAMMPSMLVQNKRVIEGVIQQAMAKRGGRMPA